LSKVVGNTEWKPYRQRKIKREGKVAGKGRLNPKRERERGKRKKDRGDKINKR
jgi:hypothetical protein